MIAVCNQLREKLIAVNSAITTLDQSYQAQRTALMKKADRLEQALKIAQVHTQDVEAVVAALHEEIA